MAKGLATVLATLMVAGAAYAQTNPPGAAVPPHTPGVASDKASMTGEMKKDNRQATKMKGPQVPNPDTNRTQEGGNMGTNKAEMRAEGNAAKRDAKHPGRVAKGQGGTPK